MNNRVMAFIDENGDRIEYEIVDELIVNKNGYMLMAPKNNKSDINVFKLITTKQGDQLELVEDKTTSDLIKSKSKLVLL